MVSLTPFESIVCKLKDTFNNYEVSWAKIYCLLDVSSIFKSLVVAFSIKKLKRIKKITALLKLMIFIVSFNYIFTIFRTNCSLINKFFPFSYLKITGFFSSYLKII